MPVKWQFLASGPFDPVSGNAATPSSGETVEHLPGVDKGADSKHCPQAELEKHLNFYEAPDKQEQVHAHQARYLDVGLENGEP